MTQTILITGGAGFIGSRLSLKLAAKGHKVIVLDNLAPQIHGATPEQSPLFCTIQGRVEFLRGSVTSPNDLMQVLSGVDTVVHLAAETGTGQSMYSIRHYSDVNVGGTALLLDLIANKPFPVKKIVVASSRAVYGEGKYKCMQHGVIFPKARRINDMEKGDFSVHCPICNASAQYMPTDEDSPVCPSSVYGITKLNQEQMVLTVGRALGISALAFRYQNVYGPGQSLSNPYTGILSIFSTRIRNENAVNIFEDGRESRDFVYIDDVVDATIQGIEYEDYIEGAFNVGSGVATDVLTIANTLRQLLERDVPVSVSKQFRVGDIRHSVADLEKICATFGFKPKISFDEGLHQFVSWVKEEKIQRDNYDDSLCELREKGLFK